MHSRKLGIRILKPSKTQKENSIMIVVEVTYKKPIEMVDKFLEEHRHYLDKYYAAGILIASGPQEPRDGGIIIAQADKNTMESILKEDPFYQHDIADYRVIEFTAVKTCEQLKPFIKA
jgi:uncharacterized protein YciI